MNSLFYRGWAVRRDLRPQHYGGWRADQEGVTMTARTRKDLLDRLNAPIQDDPLKELVSAARCVAYPDGIDAVPMDRLKSALAVFDYLEV